MAFCVEMLKNCPLFSTFSQYLTMSQLGSPYLYPGLVDGKRYGDLLPTMLNYVRCMMWKNTLSNLRTLTTEALSKQIHAALDGWNTLEIDTLQAPCSMT